MSCHWTSQATIQHEKTCRHFPPYVMFQCIMVWLDTTQILGALASSCTRDGEFHVPVGKCEHLLQGTGYAHFLSVSELSS